MREGAGEGEARCAQPVTGCEFGQRRVLRGYRREGDSLGPLGAHLHQSTRLPPSAPVGDLMKLRRLTRVGCARSGRRSKQPTRCAIPYLVALPRALTRAYTRRGHHGRNLSAAAVDLGQQRRSGAACCGFSAKGSSLPSKAHSPLVRTCFRRSPATSRILRHGKRRYERACCAAVPGTRHRPLWDTRHDGSRCPRLPDATSRRALEATAGRDWKRDLKA